MFALLNVLTFGIFLHGSACFFSITCCGFRIVTELFCTLEKWALNLSFDRLWISKMHLEIHFRTLIDICVFYKTERFVSHSWTVRGFFFFHSLWDDRSFLLTAATCAVAKSWHWKKATHLQWNTCSWIRLTFIPKEFAFGENCEFWSAHTVLSVFVI